MSLLEILPVDVMQEGVGPYLSLHDQGQLQTVSKGVANVERPAFRKVKKELDDYVTALKSDPAKMYDKTIRHIKSTPYELRRSKGVEVDFSAEDALNSAVLAKMDGTKVDDHAVMVIESLDAVYNISYGAPDSGVFIRDQSKMFVLDGVVNDSLYVSCVYSKGAPDESDMELWSFRSKEMDDAFLRAKNDEVFYTMLISIDEQYYDDEDKKSTATIVFKYPCAHKPLQSLREHIAHCKQIMCKDEDEDGDGDVTWHFAYGGIDEMPFHEFVTRLLLESGLYHSAHGKVGRISHTFTDLAV